MKNINAEERFLKSVKNGKVFKDCKIYIFVGIVFIVVAFITFGLSFKGIREVGV